MNRAEIEGILSRLESAPARFAALLSSLEDADAVASVTPGEWSPAEVLAHVRAANDILEPRIFQVLVRDNPALLAFDERRWCELARYASLPVTESLNVFRLRRRELVRALRAIPEAHWQRTGVHETRGTMTLLDLARYIADHDDEHLAQIERAIVRDAT
jgi:hypothetical protein